MFSPAAFFTPASIADFWWNNDDVVGSLGANPAQLTDRIGAYQLTPVGAIGGSISDIWDGQRCLQQNLQGWKSTSPAVASVFSGGVNWWACFVGQYRPQANLFPTTTLWSAGLSSDSQQYMAITAPGFNVGHQRWLQRQGAAAETQDTSSEWQGPFPYCWLMTCGSDGLKTFYRDGLVEQTFTRATGGALGVDTVGIGSLIQGASLSQDGSFIWRHFFGGSGALTATQREQINRWVSIDSKGFSWKKGMVPAQYSGITYVVITGPAQSNDKGAGEFPVTPVSAPGVSFLKFNSFRSILVDPWSVNVSSPFIAFNTTSKCSYAPALSNTLWASGKYTGNDALFFIPNGIGGSSMADDWCLGLGQAIPQWSRALNGAWVLRLIEVFRNSINPLLRRVIWYQGETDALNEARALDWGGPTRAQACRQEIEDWVSELGYQWESSTHHNITILPVTSADPSLFLWWDEVRTSQINFAAAFPDCVPCQAPDGPWTLPDKLHLDHSAQDVLGSTVYAPTM